MFFRTGTFSKHVGAREDEGYLMGLRALRGSIGIFDPGLLGVPGYPQPQGVLRVTVMVEMVLLGVGGKAGDAFVVGGDMFTPKAFHPAFQPGYRWGKGCAGRLRRLWTKLAMYRGQGGSSGGLVQALKIRWCWDARLLPAGAV